MNITEWKQKAKKKLKKKWQAVGSWSITGTKLMKALKWKYVVDVIAILGIATILLLTVVLTVLLMLIYMAVVGAIILWEERNGL
jgi:hypothetical protein